MQKEAILHSQVCDYIKLQYPNIIFNSDMSGVKLTKLQAIRAAKLRSSKSFPDLAIYEPRDSFSGLFIELKADGVRILKKDGKTYANEHIEEQHKMLQKLLLKGYFAVFAVGFEAAKQVIDEYLKL